MPAGGHSSIGWNTQLPLTSIQLPPQVWAALNDKAQPLLGAVPALRRYLDGAVRWFNQPGQPRSHGQ